MGVSNWRTAEPPAVISCNSGSQIITVVVLRASNKMNVRFAAVADLVVFRCMTKNNQGSVDHLEVFMASIAIFKINQIF